MTSRARIVGLAVLPLVVALAGACGGSSKPTVKDAAEAERILNSDWSGGAFFDGQKLSSCSDANGNWIAGCHTIYYDVVGQANLGHEPSEKGWTFWWTDAVSNSGNGESATRWCYGIIPAYDRWPSQIFSTEKCD